MSLSFLGEEMLTNAPVWGGGGGVIVAVVGID